MQLAEEARLLPTLTAATLQALRELCRNAGLQTAATTTASAAAAAADLPVAAGSVGRPVNTQLPEAAAAAASEGGSNVTTAAAAAEEGSLKLSKGVVLPALRLLTTLDVVTRALRDKAREQATQKGEPTAVQQVFDTGGSVLDCVELCQAGREVGICE